jgi:ankyrin repeat protein
MSRVVCFGTTLFAAAFGGHLKIVEILLHAGSELEGGLKGETPVQAARTQGHSEVVELLKNRGALADADERSNIPERCSSSDGGAGDDMDDELL